MTTPEKVCERCNGSGKLLVDDTTHRMCICLYNRKMRVHLGPELMSARPIFDSPLYQQVFDTDQGNLPTVDLTTKNLFIKTWWNDLLGHLTWAFYCKGPNWYFQLTTDERIRTVFVGNESYRAKSRKSRDDIDTLNSLTDLIGDQYGLVIVRLGFLGYKNVAMAGALLEALRIREVQLKPTWVIEEPNSIFGPGHFSYSEELAEYLEHRFEVLDIVKNPNREAAPRGIAHAAVPAEDYDQGMSLEDERPDAPAVVQPPPRMKPKTRVVVDEKPMASTSVGDSMMDQALGTGPKKWGGKKKSWGNNGGGPV